MFRKPRLPQADVPLGVMYTVLGEARSAAEVVEVTPRLAERSLVANLARTRAASARSLVYGMKALARDDITACVGCRNQQAVTATICCVAGRSSARRISSCASKQTLKQNDQLNLR